MKYNELVEEIDAEFEKKKVNLMGPVVPETLQSVHTVNSVITQTPVLSLPHFLFTTHDIMHIDFISIFVSMAKLN